MGEKERLLIGDRLRELRKKLGLNSEKMAEIAGISRGAYSPLENSLSEPSGWPIYNLVKNTDVNPFWLLLGVGPMLNPDGKKEDPKLRDIIDLISDDPDRRELVYDFLVNIEELDRFVDLLKFHIEKKKGPEKF